MNWYKKIMYGRYGMDQLGMALCIAALIFAFLGRLIGIEVLNIFGVAFMGAAVYRVMSKNIFKRNSENQKFLKKWNPFSRSIKTKYLMIIGSRTYKYFSCPGCGQKLRVPRKKGNVSIKCPKCGVAFKAKT